MLGKREAGVSITAQGPLSARWMEHRLGVRPDEAANRLLPVLPNIPPLGLLLAQWPTLFAHRLTGYVPKTFRVPFEGAVTPLAAGACTLLAQQPGSDTFAPATPVTRSFQILESDPLQPVIYLPVVLKP